MLLKRKNKIKESYVLAKLNFKKEIGLLICFDALFLIAGIVLYCLFRQILILPFAILLIIGTTIYLLGKPKRLIEIRKKKLEDEFVHVFAYFSIFIKNGRPVYSALEDTLRYCSDEMSKKIQNLLEDIDKDKSVNPFITFGDNFKNLEIKQILVSIYKMSIEGGGEEYLRQFDTLFSALSESKRQDILEKEKSHLANFNILPLIASAMSIGIIIISIVVLMEEYTSVI